MLILKKRNTRFILFANVFLCINLLPTYASSTNKKWSLEKVYIGKEINLSKLIHKKTTLNLNLFEHNIKNINNSSLKNILVENDIRLDHLINSLTVNNFDLNRQEEFSIDIESDKQYRENNIYYAEGNVIFYLNNGTFKTDKFSYDKTSGQVTLTGNIKFEKGKQYFTAELINYNFNLEKGEIIDVEGVISFRNLDKDLNLYPMDELSFSKEELDIMDIPGELELLNTKNARLDNILGLNPDLGKISNWKFKSDQISVKKDFWESEKIEFSNDPYENSQFAVESKNFKAEIVQERYKFTSKSTFLIFENKVRIPVGNRTINDIGNVPLKWGIGYDTQKRDGLYIYRSSDPYKLFKNLEFSLTPYFLVQRAIRGKTKSFRAENSSFLDQKVLQETNYTDYLALDTDIKAKIFDWKYNIKTSLSSFNQKRLNDSLSINANITKELYSNSNQNAKFSVSSGFYGAYLKDTIYKAYGTKLLTDYSVENKGVKDDYSLILDIGNYESRALGKKQLLSLGRYGTNASWNRSYKLFDLNDKNLFYDSTFNKTPFIVDKAILLNTKIASSFYQYSNQQSQSIFLAGIGPSLTLGNLKNDFLDYTYLSVMPEFIVKNGKSPFVFDNFDSHSRIKFNLKQQIYGPLLFAISTDLIISNKSDDYGEFKNIEYSLDISRRAYNVSFYYKSDTSYGLKFSIFNFNTGSFDKS